MKRASAEAPSGEPPPQAESPAEAGVGRLLRLSASCPRCGSRPAIRITEETARLLQGHRQGARLGTFQCQRRGCGTIYDLFASGALPED